MWNDINKKKLIIWILSLVLIIGLAVVGAWLLWLFNLWPTEAVRTTYTGEDFGIERVVGGDYDNDGIDDYMDIMLGARKDAENHPRYDGAYQADGYPPDDVGVCTDVVWRAFMEAGYELRYMVDQDIRERPEAYPWIEEADDKIDFRRVKNLEVFFQKYAEKLTNDTEEIAEWQPGDIAIFDNGNHIGIVSDKRNSGGKTYIIHNGGQPNREEDYLKRGQVSGHYRWKSK